MKVLWTVLFTVVLQPLGAWGLNTRQEVMIETLNRVHDVYFQHYAPLLWKNDQRPELIQKTFVGVFDAIKKEPEMTKDRFRGLLYQAVASTRDYHVNILFYSTETSALPFVVRTAEKRVFVAYLNRLITKDDPTYAGISVGDEILEWNGKPAFSVIESLMNRAEINSPGTDLRFAELFMTSRIKSYRLPVEKGTFLVKFKHPVKGEYSRALTWKYTEEEIPQETPIEQSLFERISTRSPSQNLLNNFSAYDEGIVAFQDLRDQLLAQGGSGKQNVAPEPPPNPHRIGGRTSYVPRLGTIVWENEKKNPFAAYVYKNEAGRLIGYLRMPSYAFAGNKQDIKYLEDNLQALEEKSDALVFDQVSNPGGSLFFTYAVISRLINEPAFVLPHQLVLSEQEGMEAFKLLQEMNEPKKGGKSNDKDDDDDEDKDEDGNIGGLVVGSSFKYGMKDYAKFVLAQLNKGRRLTEPYPLYGISQINPNPSIHYTKPILMLIDHADISGGDFTPAMLQDAGRVKLLGSRTSGAGGFIRNIQFPNQFGISGMSFTGSKAIRKNGKPLENLGVEPDIQYDLSVEDLQKGYKKYREAINKAVTDLIDVKEKKDAPPADEKITPI